MAEDTYNPGDHKVDEIKAYVEEHPEEAQAVLEAEQGGENRSTLVKALQAVVDNQHEAPEAAEPAPVTVEPSPTPTTVVGGQEYTVDPDRGHRIVTKKDYTQNLSK